MRAPDVAMSEILDDTAIVVLDAHGVVFNRVFPTFIHERAVERGDDPADVWQRWRTDQRQDFWEGRTTPADMWEALFPGDCPARLSADLERRCRPGPLFDDVMSCTTRLWMLSNHRSDWLLPRLARFGIADRFERVLVSDQLRAAKPDPGAFAPLVDASRATQVRLLDDSAHNVVAARALGIDAHLITDHRQDGGA